MGQFSMGSVEQQSLSLLEYNSRITYLLKQTVTIKYHYRSGLSISWSNCVDMHAAVNKKCITKCIDVGNKPELEIICKF